VRDGEGLRQCVRALDPQCQRSVLPEQDVAGELNVVGTDRPVARLQQQFVRGAREIDPWPAVDAQGLDVRSCPASLNTNVNAVPRNSITSTEPISSGTRPPGTSSAR
jgi:hypothetical protein